MDDITQTGSDRAIINKLIQPHLIIQALAFTAILYFTVGETLPNSREIAFPSAAPEAELSATVSYAVLQYTAKHSRLSTGDIHIIEAQPHTWSDNCLGLGKSEVECTQMPVPGWQVAIASGQKRWIYRTNASGSVIKLEGSNSSAN